MGEEDTSTKIIEVKSTLLACHPLIGPAHQVETYFLGFHQMKKKSLNSFIQVFTTKKMTSKHMFYVLVVLVRKWKELYCLRMLFCFYTQLHIQIVVLHNSKQGASRSLASFVCECEARKKNKITCVVVKTGSTAFTKCIVYI